MEPILSFKNFSFRYKSQNEATLKDINLDIYPGEKVLILGPSGSGKSTLGSCINGLIPFSYPGEMHGEVKIVGKDATKANLFSRSQTIGTVLQDTDAQFIGLSVGEDIAFSLENEAVDYQTMHEEVRRAAAIVNMQDFLDHNPYMLSGGQKQKVAIAGVLHHDVKILLFDEPLAALDPSMGKTAVDLIDKLAQNQNKTIIIIEHRLEDVLYRHIDRIVFMQEGRIIADTTPQKLLASGNLHAYGIREPLYIAAMRQAGIDLTKVEHIDDPEHFSIPQKARIREAFGKPIQQTSSAKEANVVLEVKNVTFGYEDKPVVKDVSFTVRQGERIAVVGQNGAGKSTIARLIAGMEKCDAGSILIDGVDTKTLSLKENGELVGFVMQNPNRMLIKDIIVSEVGLASELRNKKDQDKIAEVLKMCDLYNMRNWPIGVLSYGQKKRVTIASMLTLAPKILIVDEPTAGQDYHHYTEIMRFLEALNKHLGITILFITHDMHLALEYTDRAIVFADGNVVKDASVYDVLTDTQVIEKASLKKTSLSTLAQVCQIDEKTCIQNFIALERGNV